MLNYFALGVLFFSVIVVFYGIIVIHDIPYEIAEKRNHPHQDALHVAGWVSLFTLHAIWPFLWIWAMLYREDRGWGMQTGNDDSDSTSTAMAHIAALEVRLEQLEQSLTSQTEVQQVDPQPEEQKPVSASGSQETTSESDR